LTQEDDGEEGDQNGEVWSTDNPTDELQSRRKTARFIAKAADENMVKHDMEKLVLSDDDIEDD